MWICYTIGMGRQDGTCENDLELICDLVRACGRFIKNADRSHMHVDAKSGRANFVTEYDRTVQERLRAGLSEIMPEAHFVGEEGATQRFAPVGKFFIVDPIDGTTNFIKDYDRSETDYFGTTMPGKDTYSRTNKVFGAGIDFKF